MDINSSLEIIPLTTFVPITLVNSSYIVNGTFEERAPVWAKFFHTLNAVIMTCNIVTLMMGMGAATYWREVLENLKRPWGCLIGMTCQFGLLPAAGFGICYLLNLTPYQSIGVLIISCSPGGAVSNFFTYWVDGDLALSIVMTTVSSIVAFGAMPFNLWIYSNRLDSGNLDYEVVVPYKNILISMAFVTIPSILGMVLRHFNRKWGDIVAKICGIIGWFGTTVSGIILAIIYWNRLFLMDLNVFIMSFVMPLVGVIFAFLISKIVCFTNKVARTVAIETGCQNVVVAVNVMMLSFPDPEIRGQIILFPILYGLFQIVQVFLFIIVFQGHKFMHRHDVTEEEVKMVTDSTLLEHVAKPTSLIPDKLSNDDGAGNTGSLKKVMIEKEENTLEGGPLIAQNTDNCHRRTSMASYSSKVSEETSDYLVPPTHARHKYGPPDRFANFLYLPSEEESVYQSISSDSNSTYDNDDEDDRGPLRHKNDKYNRFYSCSDDLYLSNKEMEQFYEVPTPNDDITINTKYGISASRNQSAVSKKPLTNQQTYSSRALRRHNDVHAYMVESSNSRSINKEIYNDVSEIDTPRNFNEEPQNTGNVRAFNDLDYIRAKGAQERSEEENKLFFMRNINQDIDEKEQNSISTKKIPRSPSLNKGYQFTTFAGRSFEDRNYD